MLTWWHTLLIAGIQVVFMPLITTFWACSATAQPVSLLTQPVLQLVSEGVTADSIKPSSSHGRQYPLLALYPLSWSLITEGCPNELVKA